MALNAAVLDVLPHFIEKLCKSVYKQSFVYSQQFQDLLQKRNMGFRPYLLDTQRYLGIFGDLRLTHLMHRCLRYPSL